MCGYSAEVWSCVSVLGSREYGGRTPEQKGEGQHNLPNDLLLHESASHSRFQLTTRDLGRHRQMANLALSRRQRGFESRWGHKIKPPSDQAALSQHGHGSTVRDLQATQELRGFRIPMCSPTPADALAER
jgi:hypothetical protein